MNSDQWLLMDRESKINTPNLKYHNYRGALGLRYNMYALQELFFYTGGVRSTY